MERYILTIDQSTSGTKAILMDQNGDVACRFDLPHRQIVDERGWVEHDPDEIYRNLLAAVKGVLKQNDTQPEAVVGAALSNQRETAIVWNKNDGAPLYNAIVWQCGRGEEICKRLTSDGYADQIRNVTGIPVSPYYSAAKIAWILENVPGALAQAREGTVCCSTMDSWLIYKLCGGTPKTDYSNASRTQMFNIRSLQWADDVCGFFGIPMKSLPQVCDSNSLFGYSDFGGIFPKAIPIHGVMGDSHGALYAQGCHHPGMVKVTYGTGSSVMMNIGEKPVFSKSIVTSLAWGIDGKVNYVLEGNINYTGATIKWLVENMGILESSKQAGAVAATAKNMDGLYLVPAFSGLGAPYWNGDVRAMICGMSRGTGKAEIVRAAEECIAYQIADVLFEMRDESHMKIDALRGDGGPTRDAFLMQFQSDIIGVPVRVSGIEELSGAGPAYLAGLALGFYTDPFTDKESLAEYHPQMDCEKRATLYVGWKRAVATALHHN